jgi:mono/diheme cytochrome c family protein
MRLALALASIIVFIVHGIVFYDQFFHRWERHQAAYFDQAATQSTSEQERAELAARRPAIEQIIVTQFGENRVDRCTTCHIAIDDPRFSDHFHPLMTHPYSTDLGDVKVDGRWERRHKFSDFGCTVCHDGQGRGLEELYSHGEDHYWPMPLLGYVAQDTWNEEFKHNLIGIDYMQANCAQCHTDEGFPGTYQVTKGRELFFQKGCYGCHRIEGLSESTLGPDLSEAGQSFNLDYLWESIVEPRANLATSFMPRFELSDSEVRALVIFMKSRKGKNFTETQLDRFRARLGGSTPESAAAMEVDALAEEDLAALGARLISERACLACHKLDDSDGRIAPDLSFQGLIRDEIWLMEHFKNPRSLVSDSIMPTFRWADTDFEAMTAYLLTRTEPPSFETAQEAYQVLCARCHGENGAGDGPVSLYLDPSPRDLTKASFMNSKPIDRFVSSIRDGVPGTSMPPWKSVLNEERTQEVLDYILDTFPTQPRRELKQRDLPETSPVAVSDESIARGEDIYLGRCTGCHGLKADGKGPNSPDMLPRPRNLRNSEFINSINDRRMLESILYGIQGTAMPSWLDYGYSKNDAGDLVNYIRSLNTRR